MLHVHRADQFSAGVEEYEVGPLPSPTTYSTIVHSKWQRPIPYTVRPYSSQLDTLLWDEFICRQLSGINDLLRDVTNHTFSPDCRQQCLTYR